MSELERKHLRVVKPPAKLSETRRAFGQGLDAVVSAFTTIFTTPSLNPLATLRRRTTNSIQAVTAFTDHVCPGRDTYGEAEGRSVRSSPHTAADCALHDVYHAGLTLQQQVDFRIPPSERISQRCQWVQG